MTKNAEDFPMPNAWPGLAAPAAAPAAPAPDADGLVERSAGKIWFCKIGEAASIPSGADAPMREAVAQAYRQITGNDPRFIFSGWGGELSESERAVVENRLPEIRVPNDDEVICPGCVHQFRAVPVNVQSDIAALRATVEQQARELAQVMRERNDANRACLEELTRADRAERDLAESQNMLEHAHDQRDANLLRATNAERDLAAARAAIAAADEAVALLAARLDDRDKDSESDRVLDNFETLRAAPAAAPAAPAPDAPIRDALERLVHLRFVEEYPQDNEWDSAWIAGRDSLAHVCGDACPHASSCAVHNAPALPVGPCDCGAALSLPNAWPGLAAPAAAPAAPAPDEDALVQRLRGHVDDAEYIISGESKPHPLMAEAADLIEQQARALAEAQRDLHTAKMDRNTYDHAHKRQAAATLEATARAERAESALAARDAAIAAERREASLLYGKVRHEFYVLGYGEAVADRRMSEQFPITTKIWIAENDAARAQIGGET